ncbi:trimeric intracellular cation channel family protein [Desulfovibrio sp. JC010]|uniref:trimeric intracellular cation channel family protein n=1 Tax=Desulfovibrio sp. JC010 TaxID=2593641 RepID=UPI0013CFDA51|nr:trimeric intracellular cation channel family protein [Desulfovibrio sp. JC010]NDV25655.1 trimeric intracellular cation channel family protein [Desulfovibrio sp. JC010]
MSVLNGEMVQSAIHGFMYFGDIVFAVSGALAAGRRRMDIVGYVLIGTITGLGGGSLRDVLLDRPVWWTREPVELYLCIMATLLTYFCRLEIKDRYKATSWFDALGLSAFAVTGSTVALQVGVPWTIAVFMGVMTATGGGVIRDVLTGNPPMILCAGEFYAVAALAGSFVNVGMLQLQIQPEVAMAAGFMATLIMRGASMIFNIRLGPPGEFVRVGGRNNKRTYPNHKQTPIRSGEA